MPLKHIFIILGISLLTTDFLNGQDIHYSQYFLNYPSQSPIQTGLYQGNHRITANYRNQWQTVAVPYLTLSMFYDSKIKLKSNGDYIGAGIGFDYDRAGDSELSLTSLNVSLNYGLTLKKSHLIIIGLSPNVGQRRLSEEKLKWNNQWNGDRYDPNLSPRENFKTSGSFFLDLSGGLAYQYSLTKRSRILLGGAMFHLLEPDQTFYGLSQTKVQLPQRMVLHANLDIGIGSFLDLMLSGQFQQQDKYEETVGSGMFRLYLDKNPGVKLNLLLGCGIRLEDAFYPILALELKNWLISGSYDINTSDFKTASNKRGGPELTVQYVFRGVEPVGIYKKCPIY
ncbi:MAG: PorP/SprF family type IX secretion system membrane protein [Saprospiraceae bacterium]|nr:PorP/SprF family type IX secretion system membrane protein [Saprospiraceae bacterium]MBK8484235.1 PorP/SprF family type IX secretion system membrane protein [Saprospiraceae bacterium]MBK9221634.1 PorP/SprF family type IX secretion system membrane protein [Saprospiraceae bacterium]MBK9721427.1 PorP/SprF family type IX secretion system membrane protein [Saprospiraceae bacterium]MBK9728492.1 PorP/SprF family type IX secretion system membrane protein [Saprospiraceae bacterium]